MERKDKGADLNRNVGRVMAILDALAQASDQGLRLTDVMQTARLNKTTAHRLLASLTAYGLADQHPETGRYFVGLRLLSLSQAARKRFALAPLVEPALVRICQQTQDTVYFVVRTGDEAVCIGCQEGSFPIRVLTLYVGDRRPLGINASGLALLASLPDEEVERILAQHRAARAPFPFDDIQLRRMLVAARRNGYAYNDVHLFKGMEKMTDMAAIAMPICSSDGTAVAALHLTAITQRLQPPRRASIVSLLQREAREIEKKFQPILDGMRPHREPAGSADVILPTPPRKRRNQQG
jgi:DNA-binding IclR family transcriptional regulator